MSNRKKNYNGILLLTGAAIGAAAAYYLQTPSGKKLRKQISTRSNEFAENTSMKAKALAEDIKSKSQSALDTASNKVSELKDNLKDRGNTALDVADEKLSEIKVGAAKAKEALSNSMN